jgi:hypothetical protein
MVGPASSRFEHHLISPALGWKRPRAPVAVVAKGKTHGVQAHRRQWLGPWAEVNNLKHVAPRIFEYQGRRGKTSGIRAPHQQSLI